MTLSFHRATAEDADKIAEIGSISYFHHFQDIWHYRDELQDYIEQEYHRDNILQSLTDVNTQWWMIRQQQAIGFIKLNFDQIIPLDNQSKSPVQALSHGVCVNKIYLLPQFTGQGLGQEIFQFVENLLQQQNHKCFWLEVLQDNHAAKKYYLKNGMQIISNGTYQYTRQLHQLYIMYKNT